MRLKHNKKRNTAFVYEALIRELTKSVVKNDRNKQNRIITIMKDHFSGPSPLKEELELYKSIYETKSTKKDTAEKIVLEAKRLYSKLDKGTIFKEQSALISKINKTLSNKIFTNFVPNYRSIASVYSIFNDSLPVKDRVLLEENLVEQMSASVDAADTQEQHPIDNIVYSSFVDSFNKEYSSVLSEEQKTLLLHYISSFADNGLELKAHLSEEIGRLKNKLSNLDESAKNLTPDLLKKVDRVYSILDSFADKPIDTELLETVLKTQNLVDEIEKNDTIS